MSLPAKRILSKNLPFVNPKKLPSGHRFFQDCLRETSARWIEWGISLFPEEEVWFVTQTFKREETGRQALILSHRWFNRLYQAYLDNSGIRIRWIRAMALQKRGVIHFHSLICGQDLDLLSRKRWECRWENTDWNTGSCRIYDSDRSESPRYLAREITKEGELSWGGYWQGLNTPRSVTCCTSYARSVSDESLTNSKGGSVMADVLLRRSARLEGQFRLCP